MAKQKAAINHPSIETKVVRVGHGLLGRAHTRNIEKTINKWGKKGFHLAKQDDQPGGCAAGGYTLLTFERMG